MPEQPESHPLTRLDEEDLNMVAAFVMASGSIKDLSEQYGVSYPTMRQRLNRLIERLGHLRQHAAPDPLGDYLADLIVKGQVSASVAGRIRDLHRQVIDRSTRTNSDGAHDA